MIVNPFFCWLFSYSEHALYGQLIAHIIWIQEQIVLQLFSETEETELLGSLLKALILNKHLFQLWYRGMIQYICLHISIGQ